MCLVFGIRAAYEWGLGFAYHGGLRLRYAWHRFFCGMEQVGGYGFYVGFYGF